MVSVKQEPLKGVLHLHSETGTEGGYWAFQEEVFIRKDVGRGYCKKCGKWIRAQTTGLITIERVYKLTEELIQTCKLPDIKDCPDGEHEEEIGEVWDYKGLHILKDGDRLTIYSKERPLAIIWSGAIQLRQYPVFTENAFGYWIHADQEGIDRETWARWFLEEYPAELVPAP